MSLPCAPVSQNHRHVMPFFRQIHAISRLEVLSMRVQSKVAWSMLAVALIPALYSVIYLSSLWDPASHSQALNVGIVNLDQGLVYRDSHVNVGQDLSQTLQSAGTFNYQVMDSAESAKQHVRQGQLAFALIIPANFSSNAVPGEAPGAGQLVVFASQGNNIETARIAQQFATELGHKINERLNEQRWSLVLLNAAGSKQSLTRLNQGLKQLHLGASELSEGTSKAAQSAKSVHMGAQQLSESVSQWRLHAQKMDAQVRQLEAQLPRNSDLRRLDDGAQTWANSANELGQGLLRLHQGTRDLSTPVSTFKTEAEQSLWVSAALKDNVLQVSQGLQQLDQGLQTAAQSGQKLDEGAQSLRTGVNALTMGVRNMSTALKSVTSELPEAVQLEALSRGASDLANGSGSLVQGHEKISAASQALEMGLALVEKAVPDMDMTPDGSPEGLADSVRPLLEMEAVVQNNGIGFIANVIPAALWLGAGIAVFFVNLRVLPRLAQPFHPAAQWLGKLVLPGTLVLIQSLTLLFTILVVLRVHVVHPWALTLILVSAGWAFLCLISTLTCFMGDAGKAMAMVLLALQMTSSGGVMPVELSGSFFATLSPWLPITWLAHGLKAALFGAYEGTWLLPWLQLTGVGLGAAALTMVWGRWRFVSIRQLRPRLDL
jgi:putative membrane protein